MTSGNSKSRIRFTAVDRDRHIKAGDLATVQTIGEKGVITVKHDNGTVHFFKSENPPPIEHGYALEGLPGTRLDRLLITREAEQLAQKQLDYSASRAREVSLFQSDGSGFHPAIETPTLASSKNLEGITSHISEEIMRTGFGIGR